LALHHPFPLYPNATMNASPSEATVSVDATRVFHRQLHQRLPVAVSGRGITLTDR